jgi:MscS family membrane protein
MPIVNLTQRDRQLIQSTITLPSETTREQLRHILVNLRELLRAHPRVDPDSVRVRFVAFGKSSLDIEVFAYVTTRDWVEFLGIREDILLRIMGVLGQGGAGATFPS